MSEEDKMKMRYLREQREQAKARIEEQDDLMAQKKYGKVKTKVSEKHSKFQLGDDSDDDDGDIFMGLTHRGRKLSGDIRDDFKEKIDDSSDDEEAR